MESTHNSFGFQLLLHIQKKNIKSESDVLLGLVHWFMIKNGFQNICCTVNYDQVLPDRAALKLLVNLQQGLSKISENLPEGWSFTDNHYKLLYILNKRTYVLSGILSNGMLNLSLSVILSFIDTHWSYIIFYGNFRMLKLSKIPVLHLSLKKLLNRWLVSFWMITFIVPKKSLIAWIKNLSSLT